jgi:hypothetical protein
MLAHKFIKSASSHSVGPCQLRIQACSFCVEQADLMTSTEDQNVSAPSKGTLAKATGIAAAVALLLLFAAVLPAEYGYDPLKTGAALGLTGIAKAGGDDVSKGRGSVTASQGQSAIYTSQPCLAAFLALRRERS